MKKVYQSLLLLLVVFFSFNLASCDNGNKLYILNWDEYIDEELIEEFEELYSCDVILDIAQSNETMFSKIVSDSAPYDIAIPSDYMIDQMLRCDEEEINTPILKEIDFELIAELTGYDVAELTVSDETEEAYSKSIFDEKLMKRIQSDCPTVKKYIVPYFWGSLGIMYNTNKFDEEFVKENGWRMLYERELIGNAKVGMYASARDSIASALLYKRSLLELEDVTNVPYSLNTINAEELNAAGDALDKMNFHAWSTDELKTGVAVGKYDLALVYSGDFFDTLYSAYDVEEGVEVEVNFNMVAPKYNNVFFDAMVIPNNSLNTELAHKFIAFMITKENALRNAQYVGYCPTIKTVFDDMYNDPEYDGITNLEVYYPGNIAETSEIYKYLGTDTYSLYDLIYKKVKK